MAGKNRENRAARKAMTNRSKKTRTQKFELKEFCFGPYSGTESSDGLPLVNITELTGAGSTLRFDLYPKGQRRSDAWTAEKRQSFVNAIMQGTMNLGQVIVRYDSVKDRYEMIDGSHRLSTISMDFFSGKILWKGRRWPNTVHHQNCPEFSDEEQMQFFKNARFTAVVYTDISESEVAHIFQEANAGEAVNEAEFYNSTAGALSDLVRVWTRVYAKNSFVPEEFRSIVSFHPLFEGLGDKWRTRHGHELILIMFLHEALQQEGFGKSFYDEGTANQKASRRKMYFRYGNDGENSLIGYWDKLVKGNPKKARKVLLRAKESMDMMHEFMEITRDRNQKTALGGNEKPGKLFWNLFYFIRGLEKDYKNFKIIDPELFLDQYAVLDHNLQVRDGDKTGKTLYEQKSGCWQPGDLRSRNKEMLREFVRLGGMPAWGARGGISRRFTEKDKRTQYALQGGRCAITGKKTPYDKMEAHHTHTPFHLNGDNNIENMQKVGEDLDEKVKKLQLPQGPAWINGKWY